MPPPFSPLFYLPYFPPLLLLFYALLLLRQHRRLPGEPPVLFSPLPFLGSALSFGKDPLAFLRAASAALGASVFTVVLAGERTTFFADPSDWPPLLRTSPAVLRFDTISSDTGAAFGLLPATKEKLFYGEGGRGTHAQFAKFLSQPSHLSEMTARAASHLSSSLAELANSPPFPLVAILSPIVYTASMHALLEPGHPLCARYDLFAKYDKSFPLLVAGAPLPLFPAARRALDAMASLLLASPATPASACSALMRARYSLFVDRLSIPLPQNAYSQVPIVWAAAANTVPACIWALLYTLSHPAAYDAVAAECRASPATPDYDAMPVLHSVIMETLRVESSSITVRRVAAGGHATKAGVQLRGGDRVALFPPLKHFDPELFEEPEEWRWDRFLGEGEKLAKEVMPFGGGVSYCPGRHFALREIKAFLCAVFKAVDVELVGSAGGVRRDEARVGLGVNQVRPGDDVLVKVKAL